MKKIILCSWSILALLLVSTSVFAQQEQKKEKEVIVEEERKTIKVEVKTIKSGDGEVIIIKDGDVISSKTLEEEVDVNDIHTIEVTVDVDDDGEEKKKVIVTTKGEATTIHKFDDNDDVFEYDVIENIDIQKEIDENGVRKTYTKLKLKGSNGDVFEWEGEGDIPADIRAKLKEKNIILEEDIDVLNLEHNMHLNIPSMTETEIIIITRTDDEEELTEEELTEGETDIEIIEEEAFPAFDPNARKLDLPAFDAFPNPTDGLLMLQFEAVPGELDIRVTDLNGQQIYKEQMRNFEGIYNKQIDLRDVSKGAYLLTIRQKGQVFSRKILVQ